MKVREGTGKEVVDPELVVAADPPSTARRKRSRGSWSWRAPAMHRWLPSKRPNMLQVVAMLRELDDTPPSQEPARAPASSA